MTVPFDQVREEFSNSLAFFSHWLREDALPLLLRSGVDRVRGGFHERIGQDGHPVLNDNRRSRVQPRQIYCFAMAGKMGLPGNWEDDVISGLAYFERVYRLESGFFGALASADGLLIDKSFDLYNQAFAIFAFSQIAAVDPSRVQQMRSIAEDLLANLKAVYKHPAAGFEEANPPRTPLCSNPHMHLFEACLAWNEVLEGQGPWGAMADEIASLAMHHFIDAKTGGLREFFDADWKPYPGEKGRIMEPGHQFEWAWLLVRWGQLRGNAVAFEKAKRMFDIGETYGISSGRKVAIMSLYDDFSVHDSIARLWPQTEWLKAAVRLALISNGDEKLAYVQSAIRACAALKVFFNQQAPGLWFDKLPENGIMIDEPAPASTFYHILCAILEAEEVLVAL